VSRRLPIYLLIDVSGSMAGTAINSVSQGLQMFQAALQSDPRALDTAFVSVITFGSTATQVVPLTHCANFSPPELTAAGGTAMGEAMLLAEDRIGAEVVLTSHDDQKADWKPLVFIMTDGKPSDTAAVQAATESIRLKRYAMFVACAAGADASETIFQGWADSIIRLSDTSESSIGAFFKWVTQSVRTASASAGAMGGEDIMRLPPPPPNSGVLIVP
jgi:uncharacterized protein YegL